MKTLLSFIILTLLSGCVTTSLLNDVPSCERYIPQDLLDDVPAADLPEAKQLDDGHDDAQPWQNGFFEQTGQLEKANKNPKSVDHIYRTCLEIHREQLKKSDRGWFGRLLGLNI